VYFGSSFSSLAIQTGFIDEVALLDGPATVQNFSNLNLGGLGFGNQILPQNTFVLSQPHSIAFGLSVSFHYKTTLLVSGQDPSATLTVCTAGCDFNF
jgi:hypothetical protein